MSIFDLFQLIASNIWLYGGTFILVLSILVFVHEWGHYIVARMCGVRVEMFSIGFGKELFGINDKHGTRWKVSLIPLGGYVKMFGDTDPASSGHSDEVEENGQARPLTPEERKVAFFAKPLAQRAAIVAAGPGINFLFAILILAVLYISYGQPVTPPMASAVMQGSAASEAGFEPHDRIIEINGDKVTKFEEIRRKVMINLDKPMDFTVERDGQEVSVTATPAREKISDRFGFEHSRGMLGIVGPGNGLLIDNIISVNGQEVSGSEQARTLILDNLGQEMTIMLDRGEINDKLLIQPREDLNQALLDPESPDYGVLIISDQMGDDYVYYGVFEGVTEAVKETWSITASTMTALGQMITGTRSATELGGIIRIGAIAGDMAQAGMIALITFTALLSINLGLINLFPIPMLDGGHLVFYAVEAVKGSPISEQIQEYAFRLGLAILVGIMIFANLNDIVQIIL